MHVCTVYVSLSDGMHVYTVCVILSEGMHVCNSAMLPWNKQCTTHFKRNNLSP